MLLFTFAFSSPIKKRELKILSKKQGAYGQNLPSHRCSLGGCSKITLMYVKWEPATLI